MTVLPIIERELRGQARKSFTYWLRVAVPRIGSSSRSVTPGRREILDLDAGGRLFGFLNSTLFFGIWLFVPLIAADCLSSERREGTLGLLFLTPLTARNIVLAKSVVHGLRAADTLAGDFARVDDSIFTGWPGLARSGLCPC